MKTHSKDIKYNIFWERKVTAQSKESENCEKVSKCKEKQTAGTLCSKGTSEITWNVDGRFRTKQKNLAVQCTVGKTYFLKVSQS